MKANRTEQVYIEYNSIISYMCHLSKNLFNQVNYIVRQQFFNKERQTGFYALIKLFQKPSEEDENNNYQKLPAQTSQWTIKKVKQSWSAYYQALKEYKKHPDEFTGMPKPPKYKNKDGEYILIFTNLSTRNKATEFKMWMNFWNCQIFNN